MRTRALPLLILASLIGAACSDDKSPDAGVPGTADSRPSTSSPSSSGAATTASPTGSPATASSTPSPSPTATSSPSPSPSPSPEPEPDPTLELPRGGTEIFPKYRVVAYYGTSATPLMGVLGETAPEKAAARITKAAKPFEKAGDKPVLPAMEFIATIANRHPGGDGNYSTPMADATIKRWLKAARKAKMLLIIDVQPGHGDFLEEVKRYDKWLREPDVGLAIDPEWKLPKGVAPGEKIGSTDAKTINDISAYLDDIVTEHKLPQKLFVVHQFRDTMVRNRSKVVARKGLATVFHIDGFGGREIKLKVYNYLQAPKGFYNGFKLFFDEDTNMFKPHEVMKFRSVPVPDLITYQ